MKKLILFFLLLGFGSLSAQQKADQFTQENGTQNHDPRIDQMNYVPNEVIVKFKDQTAVVTGNHVMANSGVDRVLRAHGISTLIPVFSPQKQQASKVIRTPQGNEITIPRLDNIYRIRVPVAADSTPANIFQVINELKAQPDVEYAEPNYIRYIDNAEPASTMLNENDLKRSHINNSSSALFQPNDPLYSQQDNLRSINVDSVWQKTQGDSTQIIAIVDTGVDWNHPDLKNNIWKNPNPNTTPDSNGIVNDIRGWDFVNNDNNPMDDNGHGTHVAGIAAAEGNNGIGIIGVCPKAKIMPIKVFTNKGTADVATIVNGINYAATHGATVINMSFGGYSYSQTEEAALLNAYPNAILVAAAGNDSHSIYDINSASGIPYIMYPAAFSFVFGVQADEGYTNFDPDGPVYSESATGVNYELMAPGWALSTMPNGNYRILHGTSMAAPVVSGAVALYRSYYPTKSLEELWSDFIHSSTGVIDLNKIFFNTKKIPQLDLESFTMDDQNIGNDMDNKADAGETVNLVLKIRNTGSPANKVYAKIKVANDGNPNDVAIVKDSVFFGSIGIYRTMVNDTIPFKIEISKTCNNNSNASIDVLIYNNVDTTVVKQNIKFKIYNGQELSGILLHDTTLTADKNWVISNSLRISTGVTLNILPGTNVEVLGGVDNRGTVIAIGTPENRISMKGSIGGNATYKFADLDLNNVGFSSNIIEDCNIYNVTSVSASFIANTRIISNRSDISDLECSSVYRSYIENMRLRNNSYYNISESAVFNCSLVNTQAFNYYKSNVRNNIFSKLQNYFYLYVPNSYYSLDLKVALFDSYDGGNNSVSKNSFLNNDIGTYTLRTAGSADIVTFPDQYWGTNNPEKIKKMYLDFSYNPSLPYLNYEPKLVAPSDSCPGFVWKVLVNRKDAQDEVVDPVGVGKQRFDVYFNREMNKDSIPQVTFGGIYPYTQQAVNEDGSWSNDGKIYTVYKTIKLITGDGINRIRVAGARQATDWGWTIPVEDSRFSFTISAANSASVDFMATPGLGKVNLEWNNNNLEDGLGFNMYRMRQINDTTLSSPILINDTLITDTLYTDYAVVPNQKYFYYYKILRTNLAETDSSKVASAIPFTASKGDANGDLKVNVLDITTIVAYLLNNNPKPFIQEAADVNSDATINVLDVVGTVNLILSGGQKNSSIASIPEADLYMKNDTLFANTTEPVSGVQFEISGVSSAQDVQALGALSGFESGTSLKNDSLLLLYYSMSDKTIPLGVGIPLLTMRNGSNVDKAIFADYQGKAFKVNFTTSNTQIISNPKTDVVAVIGQNYPNPVNQQTMIPIHINQPIEEAWIRIINVEGQTIQLIRVANPVVGDHLINWNPEPNKGILIYRLEIKQKNQLWHTPHKKMVVQ